MALSEYAIPTSFSKTAAKTTKGLIGLSNYVLKPLYWLYERRLEDALERSNAALPKHIGMVLDGNRRFARQSGLELQLGHEMGASKAEEVLEWCLKLGINHITMWVFSTDNKGRSEEELNYLFKLFKHEAERMIANPRIHSNKVRVKIIGDIADFPEDTREALKELEEKTADYDQMLLNIAIGYGGREEITHAVQDLLREKLDQGKQLKDVVDDLSPDEIGRYLYTAGTPDPDFVIRTSGEIRLSGFLLWQTAYSEYYFCDVFWPSFRRLDFLRALRNYQARDRRFGK